MNERKRPSSPVITRIILWTVLVFLYAPIFIMIMGAVLVPENGKLVFTSKWLYAVISDSTLMESLANSSFVAISASVISTLLGTLAAIVIHKSSPQGRRVLESLSLISLIFPEIVFALSLLSLFFILQWELSLFTVVISHVTFSLSFVIMTINSRLSQIDRSYEDAARDLGASEFSVLLRVTLPLLKPAIFAGFTLSFLLSFDDFLITYFVNGVGLDTLPVKLYAAMKMGMSPKLNALSSLMFLFTLVVMIFFFRSSAFRVLFEGGEGRKNEQQQ